MTDQPPIDPTPVTGHAASSRQNRSRLVLAALLLALLGLGSTAWQWYETRKSLGVLEREVARRLGEVDAFTRESRTLAAQSRDGLRDVEARLGQLEARVVETQNQRMAIESLYRELSSSRDEWALAEVEQVLLIANQQLQLAGNVKAALIALETADARLARMDRPQLTALRRVINQDIERLKAAPHVDVIGLALKLDGIMVAVDRLPLAAEERPVVTPEAATGPESGGFWARLWRETIRDLGDLVRIQNVENPEFPLLSPDQPSSCVRTSKFACLVRASRCSLTTRRVSRTI
jgi:uroporphyrin-3 C-methyltransferase